VLAEALGLEIPAPAELGAAAIPQRETILVHTGAGQSIRVWPLDHYRKLVERLSGNITGYRWPAILTRRNGGRPPAKTASCLRERSPN